MKSLVTIGPIVLPGDVRIDTIQIVNEFATAEEFIAYSDRASANLERLAKFFKEDIPEAIENMTDEIGELIETIGENDSLGDIFTNTLTSKFQSLLTENVKKVRSSQSYDVQPTDGMKGITRIPQPGLRLVKSDNQGEENKE